VGVSVGVGVRVVVEMDEGVIVEVVVRRIIGVVDDVNVGISLTGDSVAVGVAAAGIAE
jgi:hypothetical protein